MTFSVYLFLLLILILSMDAFTAGLSYGMSNVRVPFFSILTVAMLSGCMLTASLYAGDKLLALIPEGLTKAVSFSVLFFLSLYKFYDALPSHGSQKPQLTTDNISQAINSADPSVFHRQYIRRSLHRNPKYPCGSTFACHYLDPHLHDTAGSRHRSCACPQRTRPLLLAGGCNSHDPCFFPPFVTPFPALFLSIKRRLPAVHGQKEEHR